VKCLTIVDDFTKEAVDVVADHSKKWLRKYLDRGIGDGSALCGDDNAADERSREHETTPP
jgi:hypothetical protein